MSHSADLNRPTVARGVRAIRIEPARGEDLDAILQIERASFTAPWSEKMMRAELERNPFARFLVGREQDRGEIVGYICYWIVFEELRIMTLAVALGARRQGIARALTKHALQEARTQHVRRVLLEVRASNIQAQRLYESMGFQRTAVRAQYYTNPAEDAILMELILHPSDRG